MGEWLFWGGQEPQSIPKELVVILFDGYNRKIKIVRIFDINTTQSCYLHQYALL